jgi:uncharacterized membrane protein YqaE (UPF0057 family)
MRYLLAIICPPAAVLLCGKPIQAILSLLLTMMFWFPGVIHALLVVSSHKADVRNKKLIREIRSGSKDQIAAQVMAAHAQVEAIRRQTEMQVRLGRAQLDTQAKLVEQARLAAEAQLAAQALAAAQARAQLAAQAPGAPPQQQHVVPSTTTPPTPDAADVPGMPDGTKAPWIDIAAWRGLGAAAWVGLKEEYRALPEWGQPIFWGAALATPVILLIFLIRALS